MYNGKRSRIGAGLVFLWVPAAAFASLKGFAVDWNLILTLMLASVGVVMKWASPSIPTSQIVTCVLVLVGLQVGLGLFLPFSVALNFITDALTKFVCLFVFGAWWVKQGHLPERANQW